MTSVNQWLRKANSVINLNQDNLHSSACLTRPCVDRYNQHGHTQLLSVFTLVWAQTQEFEMINKN